MPRRQFITQLQQAKDGTVPPTIRHLVAGEDDGYFVFQIETPAGSLVEVTCLVPDVSLYPSTHEYMIFCADETPKQLANHIQTLTGTKGKTIPQLLDLVASHIQASTTSQTVDNVVDNEELIDSSDDDSIDDYDYDDDDAFLIDPQASLKRILAGEEAKSATSTTVSFRNRIRNDLRLLKDAGFHMSVTGNIMSGGSCYISASVRISRLGISTEAMQAWQLEPSQYLMLAVYYPQGYQTLESFQQHGSQNSMTDPHLKIRLLCSESRKALAQDLISCFQPSKPSVVQEADADETPSGMHNTFISKSLVDLIDVYLYPLLRLRAKGMTWHGAETFFHIWKDSQEPITEDGTLATYYEQERLSDTLPKIVQQDHMREDHIKEKSLPLIVMQLILRHFVRCVDFCLVCHRRIDNGLEAIKPYVCERPLCLYQYLTFGFGPSIEHEIKAQPRVADLLISFAYSAAYVRKLKDLPTGLGIKVAALSKMTTRTNDIFYSRSNDEIEQIAGKEDMTTTTGYAVDFDRERRELVFKDKLSGGCPVARGSWIVVISHNSLGSTAEEIHCRVMETNMYPSVVIEEPVIIFTPQPYEEHRSHRQYQANGPTLEERKHAITPVTTPRSVSATLLKYDVELDTLAKYQQCDAICRLLDTLPSVEEMVAYLVAGADLRSWTQRISPGALLVLRWIIASNRACIMQVDDASTTGSPKKRAQQPELISGMPGFIQFRFAIGAPDKEQRFLAAVKQTTERLKLNYPTAFAWHGSPLHNWHGILREGLNFQTVSHGRAYGDGVYHAYDAATSLHYSRSGSVSWPNSKLKVNTALALNEVVNARQEYVSSQPYAVIKQLDWIQTRYLLVQCDNSSLTTTKDITVTDQLKQDPSFATKGCTGQIIAIPAVAINSGRLRNSVGEAVSKKLKGSHGQARVVEPADAYDTDESDHDDELLEMEGDQLSQSHSQALVNRLIKKVSADDFMPGELDYNSLPLLPLPAYATTATTKRLMAEVTSMRKTLDATPLSELGWYMDFEKIDNVYQWIVELHSFHTFEVHGKPLPLAKDMKDRGVKSVVLEVRFGNDFPFAPPFVRVVRPRFKTISEGGGGHVVMGGAMCMELLTNTGWSSISSMESVLLQVRLAIASEPFARLDLGTRADYGSGEAASGFIRACVAHGWVEPPGFRRLAQGLSSEGRKPLHYEIS